MQYIFTMMVEILLKKINEFQRYASHTVWEDLLGAKKVSVVETITVVKFMHVPIEICKN